VSTGPGGSPCRDMYAIVGGACCYWQTPGTRGAVGHPSGEANRRGFDITVSASVIVWLVFEALNLPAPQWRYRGGIPGVWPKRLFAFAAFSTVIPIMVEPYWLITRRQCAPVGLLRWLRRSRWLCIVLAGLMVMLQFLNDVFWLNQGIWLVPALVLLPICFICHYRDTPASFLLH